MHIMYWVVFAGNMIGATCYWGLIIARSINERRESEAHHLGTGTPASPVVRTTKAPAVSHGGAYSGVIRGWRAYRLSGDILNGGAGTRWTGRTLDATCPHMAGRHRAPSPHCECGIYVLPSRENASIWGGPLAEVVAWGEVIECCPHGSACTDANCVTGWRAEHVRIERLHSYEGDQYTAAILRARYGVEVVADIPEPSAIGVTAMQVSSASYAYVQLPNTITYLGTGTP